MKRYLILAVLLLAPAASAEQNATLAALWTYSSGKEIAAPPIVSDLNGDKKPEILIATSDGVLRLLNGAGIEISSIETNDSISSGILAADVNGDGSTELVYGCADGMLRARNSSGRLLWGFQTGGKITATPFYMKEPGAILFGSQDSTFYAVGPDGALSWSRKEGGAIRYAATSADADRNGKPGVVYGSDDNNVYYVNRFAGIVYSYAASGDIAAPPVAKDINLDGRPEIIAASGDGKVYVFNVPVNGSADRVSVRWQYNASGPIDSSLGAADLDGDKKSEIFFGASGAGMSRTGSLYILNSTGRAVRIYSTTGTVVSTPAEGDYDGDKKTELVFGTDKGAVYVLNSSGEAEWIYEASGAVKYSPATYDFNGDGRREIILAAGATVHLIGSLADNDSDGLGDYQEYLAGTNRNKNDTDGDGLTDATDPEPLKKIASDKATTTTTMPAENVTQDAGEETPPEDIANENLPEENATAPQEAAPEENTTEAPTSQKGADYMPVISFMAVLAVLMFASRRSKGKSHKGA